MQGFPLHGLGPAVTYFTDGTDAPAQTGVPLANGLSPTDRP